MTFKHVVDNLQIEDTINIKGNKYVVVTHIVWKQAKMGTRYNKYVLMDEEGNQDYRFFISDDYKFAGLGKIFEYPFKEPMAKELEFRGKRYKMVQDEFCEAVKVEGKPIYEEGDCEIWWDYEEVDNDIKGLSLGRDWDSWKREDLKTEYLDKEDIKI